MASSITFLTAINDVSKDVGLIVGTSEEFTTFTLTNTSRQRELDLMLGSWNTTLNRLYDLSPQARQESVASATITLVEGTSLSTRQYAYASDYIEMAANPQDTTNNRELSPYPGGWRKMRTDQLTSVKSGRPHHWVTEPVGGKLEIDTNPSTSEVGDVYTYFYRKTLNLTGTTDKFPFNDQVVRTLYDAVGQWWRLKAQTQEDFNGDLYNDSIGRAAALLNDLPTRTNYASTTQSEFVNRFPE